MPKAIETRIDGMVQHRLQGDPIGTTPLQLPALRPLMRPHRHENLMLYQVTQQAADRALPLELLEDQPHRALHLRVGVEGKGTIRRLDVADRRMVVDLAAAGLVQQALVHPVAQQVEFRFAHGSFESQQQAIVVLGRIIDAVLIGEQGLEDGAEVEQLMPVFVGAGQATGLQTEDDADVIQGHLAEQISEAGAALGGPAGEPLIFIDDLHAVGGPAELDRPAIERVLPGGRFAVIQDLLRRGLANVDDGFAGEMAGLDLGGHGNRENFAAVRPGVAGEAVGRWPG